MSREHINHGMGIRHDAILNSIWRIMKAMRCQGQLRYAYVRKLWIVAQAILFWISVEVSALSPSDNWKLLLCTKVKFAFLCTTVINKGGGFKLL